MTTENDLYEWGNSVARDYFGGIGHSIFASVQRHAESQTKETAMERDQRLVIYTSRWRLLRFDQILKLEKDLSEDEAWEKACKEYKSYLRQIRQTAEVMRPSRPAEQRSYRMHVEFSVRDEKLDGILAKWVGNAGSERDRRNRAKRLFYIFVYHPNASVEQLAEYLECHRNTIRNIKLDIIDFVESELKLPHAV
jgi:hypothetical protein